MSEDPLMKSVVANMNSKLAPGRVCKNLRAAISAYVTPPTNATRIRLFFSAALHDNRLVRVTTARTLCNWKLRKDRPISANRQLLDYGTVMYCRLGRAKVTSSGFVYHQFLSFLLGCDRDAHKGITTQIGVPDVTLPVLEDACPISFQGCFVNGCRGRTFRTSSGMPLHAGDLCIPCQVKTGKS